MVAISLHERFEKNMDVSKPETSGDVEGKYSLSEEKNYDDDFEKRLSQAKREGVIEENKKIKQENRSAEPGQNNLNKIESNRHLVFSAIADANPDYGNGGGNQYFIQRAFELKENGGLKLQFRIVLGFEPEKGIFKADIRNSGEIRKSQMETGGNIGVNPFFNIHFDKRKMTEDMIEQLSNLYPNNPLDESEDMTSEVSDEELNYLDENTIATEGLTQIENEQDQNGEKHEDRLTPLGNQEDSGGKNHPDSWSNPIELKEGSLYFQVAPILNDGSSETKSSYFTDEKTVNSCKDAKGDISVAALLQKLQIEPKKEMVIDGNGEVKEEYVKKYMLSAFMYTSEADR